MDSDKSDDLNTATPVTKTPPAKPRRMPKALWGTRSAQDRKKTLNRQRQQRRRARLRAEQRMRDRDVSEEEDDEIPLPDVDVHPLERAEPDRGEHTWANEELQQEDVQVVARRRIVTELAQRPDNAHATQYNDAITAIVKELAKIKLSSNVSDAHTCSPPCDNL